MSPRVPVLRSTIRKRKAVAVSELRSLPGPAALIKGRGASPVLNGRVEPVASPKARGYAERAFLDGLKDCEDFLRRCWRHSKAFNIPERDVELFAADLCTFCWDHSREVLLEDAGPLKAAKAEAERLRQRLAQCNLSAMKEIMAMKEAAACAEKRGYGVEQPEMGECGVTFHEPLEHLDKTHRELVLTIVCDKVRQLQDGSVPQSLVQALTQAASAGSKKRRRHGQYSKGSGVAGDAGEANAGEASAGEDAGGGFCPYSKVVDEPDEEELQEKISTLEEEREELQEEFGVAQYKMEQAVNRADEAREERKKAEDEVAELRLQQVEAAAACAKLVQELQEERNSAEASIARLQRKQNPVTSTMGTQTKIAGSQVEHDMAECKKQKVMLEELQVKVKELVKRCQRKGADVDFIVEELGLKEVISRRTVFERLYNDAIDRVQRLEDLRERVEKERVALAACLPPEAAAFMEERLSRLFKQEPFVSVLGAVEASPNSALRQLAYQCGISDVDDSSVRLSPAARRLAEGGRPRPQALQEPGSPLARAIRGGRALDTGSPSSGSGTPHGREACVSQSPAGGQLLLVSPIRARKQATAVLVSPSGGVVPANPFRPEPTRPSKRRPLGNSTSLPSIH